MKEEGIGASIDADLGLVTLNVARSAARSSAEIATIPRRPANAGLHSELIVGVIAHALRFRSQDVSRNPIRFLQTGFNWVDSTGVATILVNDDVNPVLRNQSTSILAND